MGAKSIGATENLPDIVSGLKMVQYDDERILAWRRQNIPPKLGLEPFDCQTPSHIGTTPIMTQSHMIDSPSLYCPASNIRTHS
jgi:hypothetical protein